MCEPTHATDHLNDRGEPMPDIQPNLDQPEKSKMLSAAIQLLNTKAGMILLGGVMLMGVTYVYRSTEGGTNNPVPPVNPAGSLRSLIPGEVADELSSLYAGMELYLTMDKGRPQLDNEEPVLKTVGDFDELQMYSVQGVQQTHPDWPSLASLNERINQRMQVASGGLANRPLDDPQLNIRANLARACGEISRELAGN